MFFCKKSEILIAKFMILFLCSLMSDNAFSGEPFIGHVGHESIVIPLPLASKRASEGAPDYESAKAHMPSGAHLIAVMYDYVPTSGGNKTPKKRVRFQYKISAPDMMETVYFSEADFESLKKTIKASAEKKWGESDNYHRQLQSQIDAAGKKLAPSDKRYAVKLSLGSITKNGVFADNPHFIGTYTVRNLKFEDGKEPQEQQAFSGGGYLLIKGKLVCVDVAGDVDATESDIGLSRLAKWAEDILQSNP